MVSNEVPYEQCWSLDYVWQLPKSTTLTSACTLLKIDKVWLTQLV